MQGEQNLPRRNTNNITPLQKQGEQTKEKEYYLKQKTTPKAISWEPKQTQQTRETGTATDRRNITNRTPKHYCGTEQRQHFANPGEKLATDPQNHKNQTRTKQHCRDKTQQTSWENHNRRDLYQLRQSTLDLATLVTVESYWPYNLTDSTLIHNAYTDSKPLQVTTSKTTPYHFRRPLLR